MNRPPWDGVERRSPQRITDDLARATAAADRLKAHQEMERIHGRTLAWPGFVRSAAAASRRRLVVGVAVAAVVAFAVVVANVVTPVEKAGTSDPAQDQARLYVLVNVARVDAGLAPLDRDPALEEAALRWSTTMANDKNLRHRPNLRDGAPPNAGIMAENVAFNTDVENAHQRLMASAGHKANILNRRHSHVGMGVSHDDAGHLWITQIFMEATSVPVAPPPTAAPAAPSPPPTTAAPRRATVTTCRCGP